ncbi:MAG: hypothetical protein ACFFFC_00605 [Candidatus Thorarchaeota archaeon]
MRLINLNKHNPGQIEVAWMWLPTFIGQNTQLLKELDVALTKRYRPPISVEEEMLDCVLDEIHGFVIDWLGDKLKIPGLKKYLYAVGYAWMGDGSDIKIEFSAASEKDSE